MPITAGDRGPTVACRGAWLGPGSGPGKSWRGRRDGPGGVLRADVEGHMKTIAIVVGTLAWVISLACGEAMAQTAAAARSNG